MSSASKRTSIEKKHGHVVHVSVEGFSTPSSEELIATFGEEAHVRGQSLSQIMKSAAKEMLEAGRIIHTQHEEYCQVGRNSEYGPRIEKWLAYYGGLNRKTGDRYRKAWICCRPFIEQDGNKILEHWNQFRLGALYELSRSGVPIEVREQALAIAKQHTSPITVDLINHLCSANLEANAGQISQDDVVQVERVENSDPPTPPVVIDATASPIQEVDKPLAGVVVEQPELNESDTQLIGPDIRDSLVDLISKNFKARCIAIDPPWDYKNKASNGAASQHYQEMLLKELMELPIADITADDAHLHLWATTPLLPDAFRLISALKFTYKSCFVWIKERGQLGLGNYWRGDTEFLLLGVKGSLRFDSKSERNWVLCPPGRHSEKPNDIRDLIELVSPGPRIELFARGKPPAGWTFIGNEVESPMATDSQS